MSFFDLSIKIKINVPANVQWKRKSERTIENKRMRDEIIGTEPEKFLLFPGNTLQPCKPYLYLIIANQSGPFLDLPTIREFGASLQT